MLVNLNDEVKVKLTEEGIQVLAVQHKEFRDYILKCGGDDISEFVLKVDENGYYTSQLWLLMSKFEGYMGIGSAIVFKGNDLFFTDKYTTRDGGI